MKDYTDFAYFKHENTYKYFNKASLSIDDRTVVFVEDSGKIYTHGGEFGGKTIYNGGDGIRIDGADTISINTSWLDSRIREIAPQSDTFELEAATDSKLGGIKIGYEANGQNYPVRLDNGKAYVYVPWTDTKPSQQGSEGSGSQGSTSPTSSPAVIRISEDEFLVRKNAGALEQNVLYIVINSAGDILYMYLNGNYINIADNSSNAKETDKCTLDEFNSKSTQDKKSKNWIITNASGKVIGIAIEGVYLPNATTSDVEIEGVGYKTKIQSLSSYDNSNYELDIVYLLTDDSGKITVAYLNGQLYPLDKVNGLQKSDVTEMFSLDFARDNNGNIIGLKYTGIYVNTPGDLSAETQFDSFIEGIVRRAGFISHSDEDESLSEIYAAWENGEIIKKASVITSINNAGESNVKINADKIDVEGVFSAKTIDGESVSLILSDAKSITSTVNTIADGYVKVTNINQDDHTINLQAIWTDANEESKFANINLTVDENTSEIKFVADRVQIYGLLEAGDATFKGDVYAKALILGNDSFAYNPISVTLPTLTADVHREFFIVTQNNTPVVTAANQIVYFDNNLQRINISNANDFNWKQYMLYWLVSDGNSDVANAKWFLIELPLAHGGQREYIENFPADIYIEEIGQSGTEFGAFVSAVNTYNRPIEFLITATVDGNHVEYGYLLNPGEQLSTGTSGTGKIVGDGLIGRVTNQYSQITDKNVIAWYV